MDAVKSFLGSSHKEGSTEVCSEIAPEVVQETTIGATIQTQENLGVTASEHVHHHVHEHITPVIQKDTHEHKVLHQVELIHEKIHEAPIIHETTTLPTISLDEFRAKTQAGDAVHNHGDTQHSHHFYSGLPKVQDGHSAVGTTGAPSAIPGTSTHTDVAGHQHNSAISEKAASAVERRSDRV
ncbi:hypothetical protein [Phaffia rhodozyma]|uniref:Allergen n=1 Tax=Phaffia rhodozyma TaxID=264483 RepID=A0A0F7SLD7_PHARH|nr:hypothetical protein [Phaffia rhodozyma]